MRFHSCSCPLPSFQIATLAFNMFMSIISHLLSAWFAFFLPCYATFKALSQRPLSEPDLQKWGMYWAVIGAFVAFEYVAEWFISWLPFYWEIKTVFLLFLSLPQTQGSTYIYMTYLQPFFLRNERELDAGIVSVQRNVLSFVQAKISAVFELLWNIKANSAQQQTQSPSSTQLSWLSPPNLWRMYQSSGLSGLQPPSAPENFPPNSRQNSNASIRSSNNLDNVHDISPEMPPPFPVPQHGFQ
ncbi:TB2/DP1, HVA22 family-domain-containing protein [Crassisporium funariophilum]|nr:TB2/DP1, HVA22 family-domain-containing protein [Crassisporium funariophilum]